MEIIKINGIYSGKGKVTFDSMNVVDLKLVTSENLPELPMGFGLELTISLDENEFLSGKDGIVWATYDLRQAEIIQSALVAQQINSEISKYQITEKFIFLLIIAGESDVNDARDFIWKSSSGLRLKPDWEYLNGEINTSFEQWLSGQ